MTSCYGACLVFRNAVPSRALMAAGVAFFVCLPRGRYRSDINLTDLQALFVKLDNGVDAGPRDGQLSLKEFVTACFFSRRSVPPT